MFVESDEPQFNFIVSRLHNPDSYVDVLEEETESEEKEDEEEEEVE